MQEAARIITETARPPQASKFKSVNGAKTRAIIEITVVKLSHRQSAQDALNAADWIAFDRRKLKQAVTSLTKNEKHRITSDMGEKITFSGDIIFPTDSAARVSPVTIRIM